MSYQAGLALLTEQKKDTYDRIESIIKELEVPSHKILVRAPFAVEGQFERSHQIKEDLVRLSEVGKVMKVGRGAYYNLPDHPQAFPHGPWCKEGDWIFFDSMASMLYNIQGHSVFFVPDNRMDAVIPPSQYDNLLAGKA